MFAKDTLEEIEQWRLNVTPPEQQLDKQWVEQYRKLAAYDSYWWLTWAGPFTAEEQQQWDSLFTPPIDDETKVQLAPLLKQSRDRELRAAIAEQREPRLLYPAIEIDEVRWRIANLIRLDADIEQNEPHAIVQRLYHGAIEEELDYLYVIEATYEGNSEQFQKHMLHSLPVPTVEEMEYALLRVRNTLVRGFNQPETEEVSRHVDEFIRTHFHLTLDLSCREGDILKSPQRRISPQRPKISSQAVAHFFEAVFRECGFDGWSVTIDTNNGSARVEQGLRQLFLPNEQLSIEKVRHLLSHELLGHVARCVSGEHSRLGLLGIHTKKSLPTEEGIALYHERQVAALHGQPFDDTGIVYGTLKTGLASGVMTPPQTFLSLVTFFELFSLLNRMLNNPDTDLQKLQRLAREYAIALCLRTYRGVPDLERAGTCYLQDAVYLHGLRLVEQAVAEDETVLDRLAVGVVALELLPDLKELGITSAPQPLRRLAYAPNLDACILSFESAEKDE